MTVAIPVADVAFEHVAATHPPRRWTTWHWALAVLGIGAGILTIWGSWAGSRSDYYAAIALSMSKSWPNFFFGAVDPAGSVTLDKIPGSFWIPALFIKAFGFSTFAVVLPNALAAVAATLIIALAGRAVAGPVAGWIAGAVVATTPILVAVSRSNQPESFFVLGLALAAWAAVHALARAQLRWLMLAGVFVAAAFQSYMLEAWATWPALGLAYLFTRQPVWRRIWHVTVAGLSSAALSVAWVAIVSLVPAGSRPYVGSTLHNNPWEMVFGYDGLGRFGQATADSSAYNSFTPPFSGTAGVFRLFNAELAGQIGWLIPVAILAVVTLVVLRVRAALWVFLGGWLVTLLAMYSVVAGMHQFYTASLAVPMGIAVGGAVGVARSRRTLWPQIALLVAAAATAIGIALLYGGYSVPVAFAQVVVAAAATAVLIWERRGPKPLRWAAVALTTAGLLLTPATWSAVTLAHPSATNPVAGGVSDMGGGFGGFAGASSTRGFGGGPGGFAGGRSFTGGAGGHGFRGGTAGGFAAGGAPAAGGSSGSTAMRAPNGGRFGGVFGEQTDQSALVTYVTTHAQGLKYQLAVFGAMAAAPLIIQSNGASILPIGGFDGNDPVPTLDAFTAMVHAGDLRYVLVSGRGAGFGGDVVRRTGGTSALGGTGGFRGSGGFGGTGAAGGTRTSSSSEILTWVKAHCTTVTDTTATGLYGCSAG